MATSVTSIARRQKIRQIVLRSELHQIAFPGSRRVEQSNEWKEWRSEMTTTQNGNTLFLEEIKHLQGRCLVYLYDFPC